MAGGYMGFLRGLRIKLGLRKPVVWPPLGITLGRHTYGFETSSLIGYRAEDCPLSIGSFCSLAEGLLFLLRAEHNMDFVSTYQVGSVLGGDPDFDPFKMRGPIAIGSDVWIGARAIIMAGVAIGNGAVIGAGSIVTKDIPPYAVAVGNPARVVRYRFPQSTIDALQALAWWDWPDDKIRANLHLMKSPDLLLAAHCHQTISGSSARN